MKTNAPPITEADLRADEDEFHSSYRIFLNAVEMLSSPAEEQCRLMGDYNVAWELKDDVSAGRYLVGRGYLSGSQEAWIGSLVGALEIVDAQVLPSGKGREISLQAMTAPCWAPLRVIAKEVINQLAPFSRENTKYLGLSSTSA